MLFTCPSRYSSTIGHTGVFSLGGWSPQLQTALLGSAALLRNATTHSPWLSATGLSPSLAPRSRGVRLASLCASVGPTTPVPQGDRFGLRPFRSPLLRASRLISLPLGTEMFQFPRFASGSRQMTGSAPAGLPHSAIQGSMRVCRSPWLIAAYHGLHRLRVPRHPPHALARLTTYSLVQAEHARSTSSDNLAICHLA